MNLSAALCGATVQTIGGEYGYIAIIDGNQALVQCGPRLVSSDVGSLTEVPSPAQIRRRAYAIRRKWTPEQEARSRGYRRYEFPSLRVA